MDPSGRTFYIDHNTQSTHWELPSAPASVAAGAQGFKSRRPPALDGAGRPDTSRDAEIARALLAADAEPRPRVDTSEDEALARQLLREMTDRSEGSPDAHGAVAPRPNTANDETIARCVTLWTTLACECVLGWAVFCEREACRRDAGWGVKEREGRDLPHRDRA